MYPYVRTLTFGRAQVAYAQRRVLILNSASWRYADRGGWDTVFLPLSRTCLDASDSPTQFGSPLLCFLYQ